MFICKNMTSTIVGTVTVKTVNPSHAYMAWVPPVHEATGGHAVLTVTVPTIFLCHWSSVPQKQGGRPKRRNFKRNAEITLL